MAESCTVNLNESTTDSYWLLMCRRSDRHGQRGGHLSGCGDPERADYTHSDRYPPSLHIPLPQSLPVHLPPSLSLSLPAPLPPSLPVPRINNLSSQQASLLLQRLHSNRGLLSVSVLCYAFPLSLCLSVSLSLYQSECLFNSIQSLLYLFYSKLCILLSLL